MDDGTMWSGSDTVTVYVPAGPLEPTASGTVPLAVWTVMVESRLSR